MCRNQNLGAARQAKNDEFYTRRCDVELELPHYARYFRDKIVYCNCDDPVRSEFWKFFACRFSEFGMRALIGTYYNPGGRCAAWILSSSGLEKRDLPCDGDFRSGPCLDLLKHSDIVVTNPPFSLFREYVSILIQYDKSFLIIGSMNAITYRDFFGLLQSNQVWTGYTHPKKFLQPDGLFKSFGNIMWFTNLDISKRHVLLDLSWNFYHGHEREYPVYANYDAIECNRVDRIPCDYLGNIGVPITFLDKHCPEQFDIVGISRQLGRPMSKIAVPGTYEPGGIRFYLKSDYPDGRGRGYVRLYDRIVIRRVLKNNG